MCIYPSSIIYTGVCLQISAGKIRFEPEKEAKKSLDLGEKRRAPGLLNLRPFRTQVKRENKTSSIFLLDPRQRSIASVRGTPIFPYNYFARHFSEVERDARTHTRTHPKVVRAKMEFSQRPVISISLFRASGRGNFGSFNALCNKNFADKFSPGSSNGVMQAFLRQFGHVARLSLEARGICICVSGRCRDP